MEPALRLLLLAGTLALGWILLPFFGPILWSGIIALLFAPVYHLLLPRLHGRPTPAALLTLLLALVIVIVPFTLVSAALAREAMFVYERVQSGAWNPALYFRHLFDALPAPVLALLERVGLSDFDDVARRLAALLVQGSQFVATRALALGQDTFAFVAGLFITTYLSFFLIRDGAALAKAAREAMPLAPEHNRELVDKFTAVVRATVKGSVAVAALQGALGGMATFGLHGFVLGPAIAAMFIAIWHIHAATRAGAAG